MYLSICLRLVFVKNYSYEKVGVGVKTEREEELEGIERVIGLREEDGERQRQKKVVSNFKSEGWKTEEIRWERKRCNTVGKQME